MTVTDILKSAVVRKSVGLLVGSAVSAATYLTGTLIQKKLAERALEDEEEEVYSYPDIPEGVNEDLYPAGLETDRVVSAKYEKPDIVDYTKYSKIVDSIVEGLSEDASAAESEIVDDNPACIFISEEEYLNTQSKFAKADATYFTQDKVLAGWNDDLVIRDIAETIGNAAVSRFDDPSVKSVYVRNLDLRVDYEIVRCDDLFDNVVQETMPPEE